MVQPMPRFDPNDMTILYNRIGGAGTIDRVGDFLYWRIKHDDLLMEIFRNLPMGTIKAKFKNWLTAKTGGPSTYEGDMTKHMNWPITGEMFRRVGNYAHAGFLCEHVEPDDMAIIESVVLAQRDDVVSIDE